MDGWMHGWMDAWVDGGREGGTEGESERRTGGRTDGRTDGWMDGYPLLRRVSATVESVQLFHFTVVIGNFWRSPKPNLSDRI